MPERNIRITGLSANLGARIEFYPGQKVGRVFYEDPKDCEFFEGTFFRKFSLEFPGQITVRCT